MKMEKEHSVSGKHLIWWASLTSGILNAAVASIDRVTNISAIFLNLLDLKDRFSLTTCHLDAPLTTAVEVVMVACD